MSAELDYWKCGTCGNGNAPALMRCRCGWARDAGKFNSAAKAVAGRKGSRKLRQHREPNQHEYDFGLRLAAMERRGEIEYYGFEEITLRWADMAYTPDYFVIIASARGRMFEDCIYTKGASEHAPVFLTALYIEVKGGHKWEDSVIKFKAARARFGWARFEMWQKDNNQWTQIL